MQNIIECKNITHSYGKKIVYRDLNFSVKKGSVTGLLGKNGTGKSTLINILTGNIKPDIGECFMFQKPICKLNGSDRAKIGLLYEGYVCYDFLTVRQIEKFYHAFYGSRWKRDLYYELVDKLNVSYDQRLSTLSCGQRSQVVLGLIFAQDPEILILDDYSMGIDAGYRKLFGEYLLEFIKDGRKSVFLTTHLANDLEDIIDDLIILQNDKPPFIGTLDSFKANFKGYEVDINFDDSCLDATSKVIMKDKKRIFGFFKQDVKGVELDLNLEDKFLGLTGRY
ncbi:ATP-binding cassette domain-containing protein [Campylobacter sp.]|uniref:ATP-binding cassette domain-containing protein n=1 Tax=Campylobacter sp. TaxID=205 RepID=UPI00403ECA98